MAWWQTLSQRGRRAFVGSFMGYGLDSYDYWVLPLGLAAITATFGLTTGEAGLLATTTLVASALGGVLSGVLADRIGRVRTLVLTIVVYAVFTALCGLASSYEMLLVFRALQGLGFGGEWAAGAILVGEYARPEHRGRAVAVVQSSWAVGWGLAVLVYTFSFSFLDEDIAWRVLFLTGALPALAVLYIRRSVRDAPLFEEKRDQVSDTSLLDIFKPDLIRTTLFASLLATGVQGGYYTLATWVPTYLSEDRGLDVIGSGGYLTFLITGAFVGYLTGGVFADWLGRKHTFRLFAVLSAVLMILYTQLPVRRRHVGDGAGLPARLLLVGDLLRVRLLPDRAVPDPGPRRRTGLLLQRRPRDRRRLPGSGRLPRRDQGCRRGHGVRHTGLRAGRGGTVRSAGDQGPGAGLTGEDRDGRRASPGHADPGRGAVPLPRR